MGCANPSTPHAHQLAEPVHLAPWVDEEQLAEISGPSATSIKESADALVTEISCFKQRRNYVEPRAGCRRSCCARTRELVRTVDVFSLKLTRRDEMLREHFLSSLHMPLEKMIHCYVGGEGLAFENTRH